MNDRNGIMWFGLGIWKLKGLRRSAVKERWCFVKKKRMICIYC
jgi:hypothetical protein